MYGMLCIELIPIKNKMPYLQNAIFMNLSKCLKFCNVISSASMWPVTKTATYLNTWVKNWKNYYHTF